METIVSKEAFIQSALKEVKILKHLFTKLQDGSLEYRPTEKQRNTNELLQYLGHAPGMILQGISDGKIGDFAASVERARQEVPENFPKHMDELAAAIPALINPMTDAMLDEEIDLFGRGMKQSRKAWLLELFLKNLVGYKMQLFLYIKASGNLDIVTSNLWQGEDPAAA